MTAELPYDLDDTNYDNHLLNYVLHHQRPGLSKSVDSDILFDIAGRTLLLGRTEFCLVTGFACGKVVFPKYLDGGIPLFVRPMFPDKLKKLKKNKDGDLVQDKATKGKAAQPSVMIKDLGLDIGIFPQQLLLVDDESDAYTRQDGRGATFRAKVSGEAMNDADMSAVVHEDPSDAAINGEHMDAVGHPDENKGPNEKEDPVKPHIKGHYLS
nr:phospholipase-like protein [Tanacetum cinerariifolium]